MVRVFWLMSQVQGRVAREKSSHTHMAAERRHICMVLASDVGWTSSHQRLARLLISRGIFHFVTEKAGLGIYLSREEFCLQTSKNLVGL